MDETFTFVIGSNNIVNLSQVNEQTAIITASGDSSSNTINQIAINSATLNFGIQLPLQQTAPETA